MLLMHEYHRGLDKAGSTMVQYVEHLETVIRKPHLAESCETRSIPPGQLDLAFRV